MDESLHYKELLQALNAYGVEYLIIGGYAAMKYGEPRFTKDLDVWVNPISANAARVYEALATFGAPLEKDGITPGTFSQENVVYQIGIAPVRVDLLTEITGVVFADAWQNRQASTMFEVPVFLISLGDLITNLKALGRDSDVEQLKQLEKRPKK